MRRLNLGGRSTVFGTRGVVACEHPQATLAGIRVLDEGGNAARLRSDGRFYGRPRPDGDRYER